MLCSKNRYNFHSVSTSNEDSYVKGLGGVGLVAQCERQQELLVHALCTACTGRGYYLRVVFISLEALDCAATI